VEAAVEGQVGMFLPDCHQPPPCGTAARGYLHGPRPVRASGSLAPCYDVVFSHMLSAMFLRRVPPGVAHLWLATSGRRSLVVPPPQPCDGMRQHPQWAARGRVAHSIFTHRELWRADMDQGVYTHARLGISKIMRARRATPCEQTLTVASSVSSYIDSRYHGDDAPAMATL